MGKFVRGFVEKWLRDSNHEMKYQGTWHHVAVWHNSITSSPIYIRLYMDYAYQPVTTYWSICLITYSIPRLKDIAVIYELQQHTFESTF